MYSHTLILEDLKLKLHLGVKKVERSKKQTVLLQIKIVFPRPPLACTTRKISDTICYAMLVKKIQEFCGNKKFILIEELVTQLFLLVKKNIPKSCKLHLRLVKQHPLPKLSRSIFEIKQ
ncbi:Dihydroneopterin aldolase [Gammaproteobacteria bacterium]